MEILIHLAKSSLYLVLFYACYAAFLKRVTFFQVNRIYLLVALLVSFVFPSIYFTEEVASTVHSASLQDMITALLQDPPATSPALTPTQETSPSIPWTNLLLITYLGGVLIAIFLLAWKLIILRRMTLNAIETDHAGVYQIQDGLTIGSFSFFDRIYMTEEDIDHNFDTIYLHEKAHIAQRHSLDILLVEILRVILWFNPVLLLYRRSLQEVHEYLADESAENPEQYARLLVAQALSTDPVLLTHSFDRTRHLKKRINMLFTERNSNLSLLRYLLIIPVIAGAVLLTASRRYVTGENTISSSPAVESYEILLSEPDTAPSVVTSAPAATTFRSISKEKIITGNVINAASGTPIAGATVIVNGETIGTSTDHMGRFKITLPASKELLTVSSIGFASQTVAVGNKHELTIQLKKDYVKLNEIEVVSYGPALKNAPASTPSQKEENSAGFTAVEQMPSFPGGISELYKHLAKNIRYPGEASRAGIEGQVEITFIVNKTGAIRNPRITKSLGFGTDEEALRVVVSMPRWSPATQNGEPVDVEYTLPVNFRLEKDERQGSATTIFPEKNLVILLDGKEIPQDSLSRNLNPTDIESMEVRKGPAIPAEYRDRATDGVIYITTKKK